MIGQLLGGRYEILDRIGGGGMALVYKARDILLNRKVAVKVLRQQYVHDEEFIHRFRREAQSAASLSHPNVVSIYDVGQQDDIHYIVMEYVEGLTLNELIKEKAPLQVEDAVHIASQICDALDHAHSNQIIHRDIKPHNILMGVNGRVKVTDFGIARAAAESSITQTGSVVGSVHYFSPEHAKGAAAGAKSDLYSLGIVLYQMLTGKLPFSGESPVSVALKHLQEHVVDPRKINPLIPQSVENIILKSMRKSPENRYNSAHEMLMDLETCLRPERRNEPKLVFDDGEDDEERTRVIPAIKANSYREEPPAAAERVVKKKNGWVKPVVWSAILLLIIAGLWYAIHTVQSSFAPNDVAIPTVEGEHIAAAQANLKAVGLSSKILRVSSRQVEKDYVISQAPKDMKVKPGYEVQLTVSNGVEMLKMTDYSGQSFDDARNALITAGVPDNLISRKDDFSDKPEGTVTDQIPPAGQSFDPTKDPIVLTVSKGLDKIPMPDLTGNTLAQVQARLATLKLKLQQSNIIYKPNLDQKKGLVYDQFPYKPGDLVDPAASDIVVYISQGMPDNAGEMVVSLPPIPPAKEGASSIVRIEVSDLRGDNKVSVTQEITKPEIFNVPVIVTPEKPAVIQIIRDNINYGSKVVTYQNYLEQKNKPSASPTPSVSASESASPTPSPSSSVSPSPSGSPGPSASASAKPSPTNKPAAGGR